MEGQGVAASAASAAGGRGESSSDTGVAAEFDHPAENHVVGDIADGGESKGGNRDDSHVMVSPDYPAASAQDASMSQSPASSQSTPSQRDERSSQGPQPEFPSQQIESNKLDKSVNPYERSRANARNDSTGHNHTAADRVAPAAT